MARLKIILPDKFMFSTEIAIRIGDINRRSHLGHVALIGIIEEARARFYRSLQDEDTVNRFDSILTDFSIVHLKQGYYPQTLRIDITVKDVADRKFDIYYKVTDSKTRVELARAKSSSVCYDYSQKKVIPIPPDVREKFMLSEIV